MIKTKSALLFTAIMFCAILMFASFESEAFFPVSSKMSLAPDKMYRALTNNIEGMYTEETPNEPVTYRLNDSGDEVARFKKLLHYQSYAPYSEDNVFDEAFEQAVRDYQTAKSITVTGELDEATRNSIISQPVEYKYGMQGEEIKNYQTVLFRLKYLPAETSLTGIFDEATKTAVEAYQQNNGLDVTGTMNKATRDALDRYLTQQTANPV